MCGHYIWILIQVNRLYKNDNIYGTTRNLNTDWIFNDTEKLLLIFFRCNNDTVLFLKSTYILKIYTEIFMEEIICLEFASNY